MDPQHFDRIARAMPVLQGADPELLREFKQAAFYARIPSGRDIFAEGDRIDAIALLISGVVRVYKIGETGPRRGEGGTLRGQPAQVAA